MSCATSTQPTLSARHSTPPSDSSIVWIGQQIKETAYELWCTAYKIAAVCAVVVAHQLLSIAVQISFWIGFGGLCLASDHPFSQNCIVTLSYGHSFSWLINAAKGFHMSHLAITTFAQATAIGFIALSILCSTAWLWNGWRTQ